MQREQLIVLARKTGLAKQSNLVLTLRNIDPIKCTIVVGCPGVPNVIQVMQTGDAVLIETPIDGLLEVRLIEHNYAKDTVQFLLSQVSPRSGLLAGAAEIDPENTQFSAEELSRISATVQSIKESLAAVPELEPAHVRLLSQKLDEIREASNRMARKDWINYVAGSLTSVCISAAFAPDLTRKVFSTINLAFSWFFASGVLLFQ